MNTEIDRKIERMQIDIRGWVDRQRDSTRQVDRLIQRHDRKIEKDKDRKDT